MFFIVGVPRSGTTLVQSICSAHSNLHVPPETAFFFKHRPPAGSATDDAAWRRWQQELAEAEEWTDQDLDHAEFIRRIDATDRSARSVFLTLMQMQAEASGKNRLGEKSPHHLKCVDELATMFPDAKFVHIMRDPRDVIASQLRMPWINDCYLLRARSWRRLIQTAGRHRRDLGDGRWLDLKYEDLVADPEPHVRTLSGFLGEAFEPGMLDFHKRSSQGFEDREQSWKGRTLQPIDQVRVDRWKHDLRRRRVRGIERETATCMASKGYRPSGLCDRPDWRLLDAAELGGSRLQRIGRSIRKRILP
tara:strand:- start:801 stop:1715 length:915 start_codon:yes stop_codon:yes gene_type:complete